MKQLILGLNGQRELLHAVLARYHGDIAEVVVPSEYFVPTRLGNLRYVRNPDDPRRNRTYAHRNENLCGRYGVKYYHEPFSSELKNGHPDRVVMDLRDEDQANVVFHALFHTLGR